MKGLCNVHFEVKLVKLAKKLRKLIIGLERRQIRHLLHDHSLSVGDIFRLFCFCVLLYLSFVVKRHFSFAYHLLDLLGP